MSHMCTNLRAGFRCWDQGFWFKGGFMTDAAEYVGASRGRIEMHHMSFFTRFLAWLSSGLQQGSTGIEIHNM